MRSAPPRRLRGKYRTSVGSLSMFACSDLGRLSWRVALSKAAPDMGMQHQTCSDVSTQDEDWMVAEVRLQETHEVLHEDPWERGRARRRRGKAHPLPLRAATLPATAVHPVVTEVRPATVAADGGNSEVDYGATCGARGEAADSGVSCHEPSA